MALNNPLARGDFAPADHGFVAWTYDPSSATTAVILPTAGRLVTVRVKVPRPTLVTAIDWIIGTAGATLTAGQCFAMLFDQAGNQVGVTADQATAWQGTGNIDMPLTAPVAVSGPFVTVGFYANGTTMPSPRATGSAVASGNAGLSTPSSRYGLSTTGLTTTPPASVGVIAAQTAPYWVGLR